MASICDFTASDGSVSGGQAQAAQAAYERGELSRSAATELIAASNTGEKIARCASGGGGGGGSGGDDDDNGGGGGGSTGSPNITASVSEVREDFPDRGDALVEVTFTNNGTARGSVPIQVVNPSGGESSTVTLEPGASQQGTQRVRNVGGQTVELGYIVDGRRVTATVSPTAPQPDESRLRQELAALTSPVAGEVRVRWSVTNEVVSGSGQKKSGTVAIDLDGQPQDRQPVTVAPGGLEAGTVRLTDVAPGEREVCVRLE